MKTYNKFDERTINAPESDAPCAISTALALARLISLGLLLSVTPSAKAQTYTTIDLPGAAATIPAGINLSGEIVGREVDASGSSHGFLLSGRGVTIIDFPGAVWADAVGINDIGQIVGAYSLTDAGGTKNVTGFLLSGGVFSSIAFPGAGHTQSRGINNNGDIAGYYSVNHADDFDVNRHGFLLRAGVFSSIDFPGASYTEAWRVNDSGQVLGRYIGPDGKFHLFLLSNGSFISIDYPSALQTAPGGFSHLGGLNNHGDIVSDYCNSGKCIFNTAGEIHGFLLSGGIFTSFNPPGSGGTVAFGINDLGAIVGAYLDSRGSHGFLRTP